MGTQQTRFIEALEDIADYAAMISGGLKHLRDAGLSEEAAENVLLHALMIPGYYEPEFEDYDEDDADWHPYTEGDWSEDDEEDD